jgi:predicted phosphodiesterase
MPTNYTPELISELKNLTSKLPRADGVKALGKRLKLSERAARSAYATYIAGNYTPPPAAPFVPSVTKKTMDNTMETEVKTLDVQELDDVVKLCKVDEKTWRVKSFAVSQNKSGAFVWRTSFERDKTIDINLLLSDFAQQAEKNAPKSFSYAKVKPGQADCCYVLNIQDLHLSKLAWEKESGADYDINIAKRVYKDAVKDLMEKVPQDRVAQILMIVGSDYFQADSNKSTTTAGTYVDSDGRLAKTFTEGCTLLTETAETLGARFEVKIIVIPGNHDEQLSYFLGAYLSAWFRNHKNVSVDNEPKSRKYHAFGKVLLGLVHGHREKLKDLPLIMMRENQASVSQYKYYEWLTGHRHIEATEELHGVKVRTCNALCGPDQWHFSQGYVGTIRTSQGLLYNKEHGLEAIFYSKPID